YVNLDLPEIEDVIPDRLPKLGKGGRAVEVRRTKTEQNEDYFYLVVGQAVYLSAFQFAWNPTLRSISIAAYTQRARSPIEGPSDHYVYYVTFTQEQIRRFNPKNRSLSSLLSESGAQISIDQHGGLRQIAPPEWVT